MTDHDLALAGQVTGLSSGEASRRLASSGPNTLPERRSPAWRRLAQRFWGPLPWMLEGTAVLTLLLGRGMEAAIITALLITNSLIGYQQSARAARALAALATCLPTRARVLRDGAWTTLSAADVVPGDVVRIRAGDIAPADLRILHGEVDVDSSALTGESLPASVGPGDACPGSGVVRRGEATATVEATGAATTFGRAARLVQTSEPKTSLERIVFTIVRSLVALDVVLVAAMCIYAAATGASLRGVIPFALTLLIASVPVALPATFSVAQAIGALDLSRESHVLVTRLPAVQEAASMDVLCIDKTGTLTQNRLELGSVHPYPPYDKSELLSLAALASDGASQDPIDLALLAAGDAPSGWQRVAFEPFDPSTKQTTATFRRDGRTLVVRKGMPEVVAASCEQPAASLAADLETLAATGGRVLAVAAGTAGHLRLAGLVALADPSRPDAARLVTELAALGVSVKMVTGDTAATARAVAKQVGIRGPLVTGAALRADPGLARTAGVIAEVFPEDKHAVVGTLQDAGHTVGMTGDGVNDAPALRQAEVGIAVEGAVDVARAAASMVLTDPGLVDLVAAVPVSRSIHQRMLTWTLNKIVKTVQVAIFLTVGFFMTRTPLVTPLQIVLLLFANDFVTMSLAVDHVRPSLRPDRWRTGALTTLGVGLAMGVVIESFVDLVVARSLLHLPPAQTQTLMFTMLVFTGQATVYLVRERGRLWSSRPANLLLLATAGDVVAVSALAVSGIAMAPVGLGPVLLVAVIAVAWMLALDPLKMWLLRRTRW
ncbi:MAG: plasma-membrane proton-efflux P-type ATPase [Candidatus Dormibacteria bacterium]